jgi:hypothetical protein
LLLLTKTVSLSVAQQCTFSITALCFTATLQVAAFGKTTLGLTYSLVLGEAVLSPAIPSVAARAGGIFFPLAKVRPGFGFRGPRP